MEIRKVRLEDSEAMVTYMNNIYKQSPYLTLYPEEFKISTMEEELFLMKHFISKNDNCMLVVVEGEKIIAVCSIQRNSSRIKFNHYATLGITVDENYRNKGIGKTLMSQILDQAFLNTGYEFVTLSVYRKNEPAIHLYKKFGFKIYGILDDAFKYKDGQYDDEVLMVLRKEDYCGEKR